MPNPYYLLLLLSQQNFPDYDMQCYIHTYIHTQVHMHLGMPKSICTFVILFLKPLLSHALLLQVLPMP